jgi:hypothetical protein
LIEEAVKFAAGGIEGVLLLFRAVVDQWAAVGMNRLAKKSLCSNLSQRGRVVQVQALHILDRFHMVAKMNQAFDDVRAAESRKMAQDGHQPLLKKTRWWVLKRKENLTSQQKFRLRDLLTFFLR